MFLTLDFPRDGEVLEPSGIQTRPQLAPDPFDVAQGRGEHSRNPIKNIRGDTFGILIANFYIRQLVFAPSWVR